MDTLFAQSIAQFANLRVYARSCARARRQMFARLYDDIQEDYDRAEHARIIHELFPKASFREQNITSETFFKIAWSFLSTPAIMLDRKEWTIKEFHIFRMGGLPAVIYENGSLEWQMRGKYCRDDKDPRTCLTLPTTIYKDNMRLDKQDDRHNSHFREYRRLGLSDHIWLIDTRGMMEWIRGVDHHRDDKDPRTGLILPAVIHANGTYEWCKNGKRHRDERDPNTGSMLPAVIRDETREYWINGVKIQ